jgi:hypothetical protein
MPRVVHFEIHATQPESVIEFYRTLFGWRFEQWSGQEYWLVRTGETSAPGIDGGLLRRRGPAAADGQAVNAFVCTIDVADLESTLTRATDLGGTLAVPRMAIPGVGWLGYVKDPDGNILGLMQNDPSAA